jgi:hypothetical protein
MSLGVLTLKKAASLAAFSLCRRLNFLIAPISWTKEAAL